jgi:tetratricopeptide (TPR) repeat protein
MAGPDPALPDAVAPNELSRDVRAELRALSKASADIVARRLVASGELLNVDPELALRHAMAARKVASRIPAVREAVGLAAYRCGQWQLAMSELRAFQRITGHNTHLAVLADCERGLGRPERAVDLFRHTDRKSVGLAEWIELLIVAAGARRDMGQLAASVTMLQVPPLETNGTEEWRARLRYAYADALEAAGRVEEAYRWFARAVELDPQGLTDAVDRLLALEGVAIDGDELPDEDEDDEFPVSDEADADGTDDGAAAASSGAGTATDDADQLSGEQDTVGFDVNVDVDDVDVEDLDGEIDRGAAGGDGAPDGDRPGFGDNDPADRGAGDAAVADRGTGNADRRAGDGGAGIGDVDPAAGDVDAGTGDSGQGAGDVDRGVDHSDPDAAGDASGGQDVADRRGDAGSADDAGSERVDAGAARAAAGSDEDVTRPEAAGGQPDSGTASEGDGARTGRVVPPAQFSDLASATDTPISPPPAVRATGDESGTSGAGAPDRGGEAE